MIQLYKTGETHDSGYPVFRPIGIEPKRGKLGLSGEYYVRVGPSGRGILSQYDQARLARGESIHNMYKAGRAYRDRIGTHDGEFEYEITDYVIVNQNPTSGILTPSLQQKYEKITKIVPFDERERLKAFAKGSAESLVGTVPQSFIDELVRDLEQVLRQYDYLDWFDERNPTKYEYATDLVRSYWTLRYLLESDVTPLSDGSSFVAGTKIRKNGRNLGYGTNNGAMIKNQLQTIQRIASQFDAILEHSDELPDWVLTKVSTAMDRLVVSFNYIQSKLQGMKPNPRVNVSAAIKNAQKVIREIG